MRSSKFTIYVFKTFFKFGNNSVSVIKLYKCTDLDKIMSLYTNAKPNDKLVIAGHN